MVHNLYFKNYFFKRGNFLNYLGNFYFIYLVKKYLLYLTIFFFSTFLKIKKWRKKNLYSIQCLSFKQDFL